MIRILNRKVKKNKKYELIDIGCSNGELIYNLEKNFKNFKITGLDIKKDLLNKAKKNVSNKIEFFNKDISKRNFNLKKKNTI